MWNPKFLGSFNLIMLKYLGDILNFEVKIELLYKDNLI